MTAPLLFLEPASGPAWAPFLGARPIAELRAGAWRIRDRWARALGREGTAHLGETATAFSEPDALPSLGAAGAAGPAVIARSDFAPTGLPIVLAPGTRRLEHDGVTVAWIVAAGDAWRGRADAEGPAQEIPGLPLRGAFDLVTALERLLPDDCAEQLDGPPPPVAAGAILLGDAARLRVREATVEPGVVFDTRGGAIVVEPGAEIRHGTRLEGPCWIGRGARLMGGDVRGSVVGPRCVVRGEVSACCFTGYANKGHDGFLGHSVLGHWVNLGAGTTTSNLKNTYGAVRLRLDGAELETGRQFLGTLFGDHAKTAIGTMLPTGTVVGAGANVFGPGLGKWVRPFAWGAAGEALLDAEGFVRVAERVLPRRDIAVTDAIRTSLRAIHARLAGG